MKDILVLYYSQGGSVHEMAKLIARGVDRGSALIALGEPDEPPLGGEARPLADPLHRPPHATR